jgi:hypothetical protein
VALNTTVSIPINLNPATNLNDVVVNPYVCGTLRFGGVPQAYLTYTVPAATGTVYVDTCSGGDPAMVRTVCVTEYAETD